MSKPSRGVKRNRRGERSHQLGGKDERQLRSDQPPTDTSSPIVQAFLNHQKDLDTRHDKYERLVKLSRDVTIESKRTIFLLHRISGNDSGREEILKEALEKLEEIEDIKWRSVAEELRNEDPYQFLRAYSPGLQEYIEALSFYHYLLAETLISLPVVEERLQFTIQPKDEESGKPEGESSQEAEVTSSAHTIEGNGASETMACSNQPTTEGSGDYQVDSSTSDCPVKQTSVHIPPTEYILGIADLTGELMRMAINSVGNGKLEQPFHLCCFIKDIHDAFVSFGNISRELPRKLFTLKQSLKKVETACYTLKVRGSEIPKHMLTEIFSSPSVDQDRVYYNEGSLDD